MISVIVALYNQQEYIKKCIESIIFQSYKNIEIIVVNDGSTDNSLKQIESLVNNDQRIKVINKKNGGLSAARNTGIENSKGDYLMFVDADDELEENAIEYLYNSMLMYNSDISIGKVNIIYDVHRELKKSDDLYYSIRYKDALFINDDIIRDINCSAWSKLFKRNIINKYNIRFPEKLYYEDAYWHWAYLTSCNKISFVEKNVYKYFRRKNSLMSATFECKEGMAIHHMLICEKILEFWNKNNILENRYKTASNLVEMYFWLSFKYSQNFEKTRAVYECARITRKFSLPIKKNSVIDKICNGDISFLFLNNNINNINTYSHLLQINEILNKVLPYNSNRRKILYYVARMFYKVIRKIYNQ